MSPSVQRVERLGVLLILLAALVPRLRDVDGPFDRGAEGEAGARGALAAVNYERLGLGTAGGYPAHNVVADGLLSPARLDVDTARPPVAAWMGWVALEVLGPEGWSSAWKDHVPPKRIELPLRVPFVAAHLLALWALWWALRQGHGARTALIGLGLAASSPALALNGTLVGPENPALALLLLTCGFHARWVRSGRRGDLVQLGVCAALGSLFSWVGLVFLPLLAIAAVGAGRAGRGLAVLVWGSLAAVLPLLAHATWAGRTLERLGRPGGGPLEVCGASLAPLFDGSHSFAEWIAVQGDKPGYFTLTVCAVAAGGLVVMLVRASRPAPPPALRPAWEQADLTLPLLLGGCLVQLVSFTQTAADQQVLALWLAPGTVALAAVALDAAAPLVVRTRSSAPLVVLVLGVALFGVERTNELRHELRARRAAVSSRWDPPDTPLPDVTGAAIAAVLPPGALGLVPADAHAGTAVSFYAWRALFPVSSADDRAALTFAQRFGLGDAPRHALTPPDGAGGAWAIGGRP